MKIARILVTSFGAAALLTLTPACEMQKAETTVKNYDQGKHDAEVQAGEEPEATATTPPTYFQE